MLIRVRELELQKVEFDETYQPGAIEFGPDFRQAGPLHGQGHAELIVEHRGHHQNVEDIRMVGKVVANLEFSCARCLEAVGHDVNWAFDLIYRTKLPSAKPRPRSAIIRAKGFCWKTCCASRCCWPRRYGLYAAKIAKVCVRCAAAI